MLFHRRSERLLNLEPTRRIRLCRGAAAWRGPLAAGLAAFGADRASKAAVAAFFSERGEWYRVPLLGDTLSLVYMRNQGVSFGAGAGLEGFWGFMLLVAAPAALAIGALAWALGSRRMSGMRRSALAAFAGAGIGNVADRALDPEGVLDFIRIGLNGAFGIDYLPAFNLADVIILASGALVVISFVIGDDRAHG
jgi:lipoprotein signal peptidase